MFPQVPSPVAVLDHPPGQADKSMFVHLLSGLSEVAAHLAGGQSVVVHLHCSLAVPTGNIMSCNFTLIYFKQFSFPTCIWGISDPL